MAVPDERPDDQPVDQTAARRDGRPDDLRRYLQESRDGVLAALEGLTEYDRRRPLTPTGTNLLGLVKHLAGIEFGYLGDAVGRPGPSLPWYDDGSVWRNGDMWARPDETSEDLIGLYRRAWAHSDQSLATVPLDAPARVAWWPDDRAETTFGALVVRVVAETARHAGHCDIVRELIDGRTGSGNSAVGDAEFWATHTAAVQAAADPFRPNGPVDPAPSPLLVVIGGHPATGKTTIARAVATDLRAAYVRIDSIETAIGRAEGTFGETNGWEAPPGYAVGYAMATDQLQAGLDVVAESVNPVRASRDAWRAAGLGAQASVLEVEVICSDPVEHRRRAEDRVLDIPGLDKPTWQAIQRRDYDEWDRDHLVIDTATVDVAAATRLVRAAAGR